MLKCSIQTNVVSLSLLGGIQGLSRHARDPQIHCSLSALLQFAVCIGAWLEAQGLSMLSTSKKSLELRRKHPDHDVFAFWTNVTTKDLIWDRDLSSKG